MLTDSSPKIVSERSLESPFGKRFFDKFMVKKSKSVGHFRFWTLYLTISVVWILIETETSNRVFRESLKAIGMGTKLNEISNNGGGFNIPKLVIDLPPRVEPVRSMHVKLTPIQVINFNGGGGDIPAGSEVKAMLLTGATNGLIKARLTEPLKVNGMSLLEAGVLILGQGRSTEERLYIDFKKAVFKDGKSISVSAQAFDITDSILGLKGSRINDLTIKLAASSGLSFLSGMASGLQVPSYDGSGRPARPSVNDASLNGVSQASTEQAKSYMQDIKGRAPIIEVKSGTPFTITFDGGTN